MSKNNQTHRQPTKLKARNTKHRPLCYDSVAGVGLLKTEHKLTTPPTDAEIDHYGRWTDPMG